MLVFSFCLGCMQHYVLETDVKLPSSEETEKTILTTFFKTSSRVEEVNSVTSECNRIGFEMSLVFSTRRFLFDRCAHDSVSFVSSITVAEPNKPFYRSRQ